MAKVLSKVAMVAGAVALVATGVGAFASPALLASIGSTLGASVSTIASVASVVATAASIGAQLLAKPPPASGTVNNITIGANQPIPYGMGRSFIAGAQLYDTGYGARLDGVSNPYRAMVLIWSCTTCLSIQSFLLDWQPVTFVGGNASGWYNDFLYLDTQLGARPEPAALAGPFGAIPGWGANEKLSGYAAGLVSFKFDKEGERWANGIPALGAVGQWAKVYDWRKDSTVPGGSGSHLWADEDTFEWDASPALNAVAYARGRFNTDIEPRVMMVGCGFPFDSIDWPAWTAFANLCDANGWEVNGHVFDGPGTSRWDNLKRICESGGGEPVFTGGLLSVRFNAPVTPIDTITRDDLADGECTVPVMRTYRDRVNAVVPKYRSEQNRWEMVQSAVVTDAGLLAEDGGDPKEMEWPLELVTDKDQAAQLSGYALWNGRERDGITLPCKPRLWEYRVGEALELDLPEMGLAGTHVITALEKDAGSGVVTLTFRTETAVKHSFAMAQTGTAPDAPTLPAHGEQDQLVWENGVIVQEETTTGVLLHSDGQVLLSDAGDILIKG